MDQEEIWSPAVHARRVEFVSVTCPECDCFFEDWYDLSIHLEPDYFDFEELAEAATICCPECGWSVDAETFVAEMTHQNEAKK